MSETTESLVTFVRNFISALDAGNTSVRSIAKDVFAARDELRARGLSDADIFGE